MIDINLYRSRIGIYNTSRRSRSNQSGSSTPIFDSCVNVNVGTNYQIFILYLIFVLYYILGIVSFIFSASTFSTNVHNCIVFSQTFAITYVENVKILCALLSFFIILRMLQNKKKASEIMSFFSLTWRGHRKYSLFKYKNNRFCRIMSSLCCWAFLLNFLLITIVNPSLLNPGPNSGKNISVAYQNVQGLVPFYDLGKKNPKLDSIKISELNSYLSEFRPSIVMLNETWLKPCINDSEVICDELNYKVFREDRNRRTHPPDPTNPDKCRKHGGGVLIAIDRNLDIESVKVSHKASAEIIAVTLTFKSGKKIILCTCYRVGTLGEHNLKEVESYIKKIRSRRGISSLIVTGDFNLPSVDWDTHHSNVAIERSFLDLFHNLGMDQIINEPTHKLGNTLDLILTDDPRLISGVNVNSGWNLCKSDHFPITFHVNLRAKRRKQANRRVYNFKQAKWDNINLKLSQTDWNNILSDNDNDIEVCWSNFKASLFSIIDANIPKITLRNNVQPPWFDSEIFNLCREKEWFRSKSKGSSNPNYHLKFVEKRRAFKKLSEKKMRDNILTDDTNSDLITKRFWTHTQSKTDSTRIPEVVNFGDLFRSEPPEQAELFNGYFFEQFTSPSDYSIPIDFNDIDTFDIDFNHTKIEELLSNINANKTMGPDGIHGKILKNCAKSLSLPLSILFRKSYHSSKLPNDWKMANVVPVHKKGSKSNVENYRPISLTSIVVKTLERIIRDELMLRCNRLIDQRQHGFLFGKSCGTQLIGFCDSLALSLNQSIRTDVIYFDFAKAFDSVSHDIILQKLKYQFSIDGLLLKFIANYLKDRSQAVVLGGITSSSKSVTSGVPQGSILGPTLFVLFLNDITCGISDKTNILMYADDTKIWREINCESDHHILQKDIDYLYDWALKNKMKFHPSKCKALMVNRSRLPLLDILPFIQFHYSIGDALIDYCDVEKDLGIHMNGSLNFTHHSDMLYSKASQRLGLLKRTCHFVKNMDRKRALYLVMVRSLFEHCPYIWRPVSATAINKLESLQKRAIKWILNTNDNNSHVSYSSNHHLYLIHCKQLKILPIKYRFDYHDIRMFHSIVYGFSTVIFPEYITPFQGSRLRRSHLDHMSYTCTITPRNANAYNRNFENNPSGILHQSFFYRSHLIWNRLPLKLREIIRPSKFKIDLIAYLWESSIKAEYDRSINDLIDDFRNYISDSESSDED